MEDERIVDLFWARDESAIAETESKYNGYLTKIAYNILADVEDTKESVNDTYLKAWNCLPPHKPSVLSTFLGRITRQTAIDLYRKRNSAKRRKSQYALSLSELKDTFAGGETPEEQVEVKELAQAISHYLRTLSAEASGIFICRYYFLDSITEVANYYGVSSSKVKSMLFRVRNGLKEYLSRFGNS